MINTANTALSAFEKAAGEVAKFARAGEVSIEQINAVLSNVDETIRAARRMYFADKRDPKKVEAAVKKAAATRKRTAKRHKEIEKEVHAWWAERNRRVDAGYLPEEVCNNRGEPDPKYYVFDYTDERSGGYRIYKLRPEWRDVAGLNHVRTHI
jgi:hypothetical protein